MSAATTYDLTVGVIVNMDEAIFMLSPDDTPLLTGMGSDGLTVISQAPVDEIQFSWMDDTILTPRSTVAVAVLTADTVVTVAAGDRTKFSTGDIIRVAKANGAAGETIRVTGYGTTTDTLLVARAWSGSAVAYAVGDIIVGLGTALAEGSDPQNARTVDRVESSNLTQIFGPTQVHVSRTEQLVRKYGVANEMTHQLMGRMKENAIAREQAFLYGVKVNSTAGKIRTTGGLAFWLSTNVNTTATELTVSNIQTQQQTLYNRGGSPDRLMSNPVTLAGLNNVADTAIVRTEIEDDKRGRMRVATLFTEFGPLAVTRNRWCTPQDAFLFTREQVRRRVLRPLVFEMLAKTGDADKGQIVCEEGLQVKGEERMARFSNLAYTGSN